MNDIQVLFEHVPNEQLMLSPAMAAGVTDRLWSLEDVVAKIDEMAPAPKPRGPYRKRVA